MPGVSKPRALASRSNGPSNASLDSLKACHAEISRRIHILEDTYFTEATATFSSSNTTSSNPPPSSIITHNGAFSTNGIWAAWNTTLDGKSVKGECLEFVVDDEVDDLLDSYHAPQTQANQSTGQGRSRRVPQWSSAGNSALYVVDTSRRRTCTKEDRWWSLAQENEQKPVLERVPSPFPPVNKAPAAKPTSASVPEPPEAAATVDVKEEVLAAAVKREAGKKDAVKKDAVKKDAIKKDAVKKDAVKKDALKKEPEQTIEEEAGEADEDEEGEEEGGDDEDDRTAKKSHKSKSEQMKAAAKRSHKRKVPEEEKEDKPVAAKKEPASKKKDGKTHKRKR